LNRVFVSALMLVCLIKQEVSHETVLNIPYFSGRSLFKRPSKNSKRRTSITRWFETR